MRITKRLLTLPVPKLPKRPHQSVNLAQLPSEILLEVFEYLESADLRALTQQCQKFSSLISNSSLADKFTLNFDSNFHSREWIGQRKYSKLKINTEKGIFAILKSIGPDLKEVTIDIRSIDLKTIARILSLCPNVKMLRFEDVKTHSFLNMLGKRELPRHEKIEVGFFESFGRFYDLLDL